MSTNDQTIDCEGCGFEHPIGDSFEVDDEDFEAFTSEVREMVVKRFGVDVDHDRRVEVRFVRRDKYKRMHYRPVPYSHKPREDEERIEAIERALDMARFNLRLAWDDFDHLWRLWEHEKREQEENDGS